MTNQSRKLASLLRPANLGAQADPSANVVKIQLWRGRKSALIKTY